MIKVIGIISVLISGIFSGLLFMNVQKRKIDFLKEYLMFVIDLKNQIKYTARPIQEILTNINTGPLLGDCLNECVQLLAGTSFQKAWEMAFESVKRSFNISQDVLKSIENFGLEVGTCDVNGQVDLCLYHMECIKSEINKLNDSSKMRGNLPIVIASSVSIMIIIILI